MDEQTQEFRVGLLVVAALAVAAVMVFRFGDLANHWKSGTHITIVMPSAAGVQPQTAVQMSGIQIGHVQSLELIAEGRGVAMQVLVDAGRSFRSDSKAIISRSLLGDGIVDIVPGTQGTPIKDGDRIVGQATTDPMQMVSNVEEKLTSTLTSFESTGREWGRLANNLNRLLETSGPDGVSTMQRSAVALEQFTRTMKTAEETLASAGSILNDPRYQQQLQRTLVALPQLLNETRSTLQSVNAVVQNVDKTVENINTATGPLADQSSAMVTRLNNSLANIETISGELAVVSQLMNQNDGTVKRLLTDPAVYRNLNATSASLAVLLENLKPVVADMQVFSDKVARHPEVLGIRGVVRGSDGTKDSRVVPASFEQQ